MVFLVIAGFGFFLLYLYAQYSSMKTWVEGQRRIMELEDKKLELQQQKDLFDSVREELIQIGDVDDLEEAYGDTYKERGSFDE